MTSLAQALRQLRANQPWAADAILTEAHKAGERLPGGLLFAVRNNRIQQAIEIITEAVEAENGGPVHGRARAEGR